MRSRCRTGPRGSARSLRWLSWSSLNSTSKPLAEISSVAKKIRLHSLPGFDLLPDLGEQAAHPGAVLLTDVLLNLAFLVPDDVEANGPWFGVRAGIVDRRFVTQRVKVLPCVSLDQVQLIGMGVAGHVDPAAFVETDDIDDERVALPAAD